MSARPASKATAEKAPEKAQMKRKDTAKKPPKAPKAAPVVAAAAEDDELGDDERVPDDIDDGQRSQLKEDPALDRRIIEGMLNDRKQLLEDLAKEGMTQAQILRRAAELGLSEALLRQVKGVAADLAGERPGRRPAPSSLGARTCLSCDRVFLSTGPGNRLCMRCRGGDAGLAQF